MATDRLLDLMKQGFMKGVRARKPKAPPRPTIACNACLNWHTKGKHTADRETRKRNLAKKVLP